MQTQARPVWTAGLVHFSFRLGQEAFALEVVACMLHCISPLLFHNFR